MADASETVFGPLIRIYSTNDCGGAAVFARFDGHIWELYADEAMHDCIGEAEDISDPDTWCWDLLLETGRLGAPGIR